MTKIDVPDWLRHAVDMEGGDILCEKEVFAAPDGTWAAWLMSPDTSPVLGLPTEAIAIDVVRALHDAFRLGGAGDYYYD